MNHKIRKGIAFALLAAALYAVNAPFSKILLAFMPSTLMAGFLYIGAGLGMLLIALIRKMEKSGTKESNLTKKELPYTVAMILLDIAAPICLLFGLNATTAANASLLNNFEIVATALIAGYGLGSCSSRFPAAYYPLRICPACSSPTALCLCFWLRCAGDLRITAPANYPPGTLCRLFC